MTEHFRLGRSEENQAMCDDPFDPLPEPTALRQPAGHWRTREGVTIRISEMSKKHLENAVCLFSRVGWAAHRKIQELREELERR